MSSPKNKAFNYISIDDIRKKSGNFKEIEK